MNSIMTVSFPAETELSRRIKNSTTTRLDDISHTLFSKDAVNDFHSKTFLHYPSSDYFCQNESQISQQVIFFGAVELIFRLIWLDFQLSCGLLNDFQEN